LLFTLANLGASFLLSLLLGGYFNIFILLFQFAAVIVGAHWYYTKNATPRQLSYGKGLGIATLISLFSAILYTILTYVILVLNYQAFKETLNEVLEQLNDTMIKQGASQDSIDETLDMVEAISTPSGISSIVFLSFFIIYFLVSLITSIFTRKERPNHF